MEKVKKWLMGSSNRQLLAKNTFWTGLLEVGSKLIMFQVTIMLVRYLGPDGFGRYNFVAAYVAMLMILSDLGVSTIITRDIARDKEKSQQILGNALGLRLVTSIVIFAVALGLMPLLGQYYSMWLLMLVMVTYNVGLQFFNLISAVLLAWEKMELVFIVKITYYLGILLVAWLAIQNGWQMEILVAWYISATIVSIILGLLFLQKLGIKITIEKNMSWWREMLRESMPIFGFIACSQVYANFDTLLIGKYFGNVEAGLYQSAYKILYAFQSINLINTVTFPRISVLVAEKKDKTLKKLSLLVIAGSIIGLIPLLGLIAWKSNSVIRLIYGQDYMGIDKTMIWLLVSGTINYFRVFIGNILVAYRQQHKVFQSMLAGVGINVVLNLGLLPKIGYEMAAVNLVISEVVILGVILFNLKRLNKKLG